MFKRTGGNRRWVSPCTQAARLSWSPHRRFFRSPGTILSDFVSLFSPSRSRPIIPAAYTDVYTNQWISSAMICSLLRHPIFPGLLNPSTHHRMPFHRSDLDADCRHANVRLGGRGSLHSCELSLRYWDLWPFFKMIWDFDVWCLWMLIGRHIRDAELPVCGWLA